MLRRGQGKNALAKLGAIALAAALFAGNVTPAMPAKVVYAATEEAASEASSEASSEAASQESSATEASSEASEASSFESTEPVIGAGAEETSENLVSTEESSAENDDAAAASSEASIENEDAASTGSLAETQTNENENAEENEYVLEATDIDAFDPGAKTDGETQKVGTNDYFTVIYSSKTKVEVKSKKFSDDYEGKQRINFGGGAKTSKNSVKFTTSCDEASLKVWWAAGANDRQMVVLDGEGNAAYVSSETSVKDSAYITTFTLGKAGTYYLGGYENNNYIFKLEVTEGNKEVVKADWSTVEAPVIEKVALSDDNANKINVTVNAIIGANGGDTLEVSMYDSDNQVKSTLRSSAEKSTFNFAFEPEISGEYYFIATLSRENEEEVKTSKESEKFDFTLPLTAPQFKNAVNKGKGAVKVKFYSVKEATDYVLYAIDTENESSAAKAIYTPDEVVENTSTEYEYNFVGLTVGHVYRLVLSAKRGEEVSKESTMEIEVTQDGEQEWTFAAFGQGVSTSTNKVTINGDETITVASTGGKGKLVPASTDGLAFYYATVPAEKNFTLSATVKVDSWTWSNGQEGFGLMAADAVGVNGDSSVFWNNSYMATATKVEYYYDSALGAVTDDTTASKISMKLGLGSQQKIGVTNDNIELLKANDSTTIQNEFSSTMRTLESSCASKGAGTYNIVGNETSGKVADTTVENPVTEFRLSIRKNNTGYFVSYTDANGNTTTQKYYDTKALENIDSESVYVGFFASRNATATFSDVELTLVNPEDDEPAESKPVTYVTPNYKVISADHSNTAEYVLQYTGNADGLLTIKDKEEKVIVDSQAVTADEVVKIDTTLEKGENTFSVTFVPDKDFHPENDEYQLLSSYESATFTHTVTYKTISDAKEIYVSPDGTSDGQGTKENPVDIYTAVEYVKPGQTIRLAGGTYSLDKTVVIARGIDGTSSNPVRMIADSNDRAVFDFNSACAGFIFAGDYWYVKGIDCTKSGNAQKGIQLSGSNCTLEDIRAYENGNTGIQVSRYLSSDDRDEWPSNDLILNCTSFSNADSGYEDADGFAAKLTCGDGIVFDGCISYNNADDGWDLYAKPETGSIGQVTIQNCVAFANGYGVDGTNEGNGNGFKMGGSSISGPHKLVNSVAWGNKAKGIDSNSGPDIQVYHSMSFNNGNSNVALYTNDTANTDYYVEGVFSYRTAGTNVNENIKAKGSQDTSKIYGSNNFFWNDGKSQNKDGVTASDDWFVSLDAPYADASDPFAVAESIRSENGKIDLGDFLKLSDTGMAALSEGGLSSSDISASLDGSYEAASGSYEPGTEDEPTDDPSSGASDEPTDDPSAGASDEPIDDPSAGASDEPTDDPSTGSSDEPSSEPECVPATPVQPLPVPVVKVVEVVVTRIICGVSNLINRIFGLFRFF